MPAKKDTNLKFDVAVIGSGPAGMIATAKAGGLGLKVVLIEKNSEPGKKLLLTGNGRCNLTNAEFDLKRLVSNYNNGEFLFHAFSVFGPERTIMFFNQLGIRTKIETNNKVFPKNNNSREILTVLNNLLVKNNVKALFNAEITDLEKNGKKITKLILKDKTIISAKKYIFAQEAPLIPLLVLMA